MLFSADPSQGLDLWLGLDPAKLRIQDLACICLCIYIMTEKANSLQATMSQNKNTVKVSWAQQWEDVIPATRSTLKLPDQPEGLLGKSPEKMPAGKPPTDTQLASQNNWSLNVWHSAPGTAAGHTQPQSNTKGFSSSFPREIRHMENTVKNPNLLGFPFCLIRQTATHLRLNFLFFFSKLAGIILIQQVKLCFFFL